VVKKFNKAARYDEIAAQRRAAAESQSEQAGA
jgi:peptide deformylase